MCTVSLGLSSKVSPGTSGESDGVKYALLISEWDEGIKEAAHNDIGELYDLLRDKGFSAENISWLDWDGSESMDGRVDGVATRLERTGHPDDYCIRDALDELGGKVESNDFVFVCIVSHGYKEGAGGFTTPTGGYCWVTFADDLDGYLMKDTNNDGTLDTPKYGKMVIVAQTCFSRKAEQPLTQNDPDDRVVITVADKNETAWATLVGEDHTVFLAHFTNKLQGDTWGAFNLGFWQGGLAACIAGFVVLGGISIVIGVLSWVAVGIGMAVMLLGGLISGLIAAIGAWGAWGKPSIYDAYDYAKGWAEWGYLFWLFRSSHPHISNSDLAKGIYV